MQVSRPAYYEWLHRPKSNLQKENELLAVHIREIFRKHRNTYGSPRIARELRNMGFTIGENRVARIMRENKLSAISRKRKKIPATQSSPSTTNNVLQREFSPEHPNMVWTGDITYLQTKEGTFYLSVILDLFSRKVVGFDISTNMDSSLVERSLQMAIDTRDIGNNLLFHSDQGSQYQSTNVQKLLSTHNIQQSMSRRGNCYDNAVTESFFSTLKKETTHAKPILSTYLTEGITKEYIQNYYNIIRGHSHNDYVSPFIKEVLYFREYPNV